MISPDASGKCFIAAFCITRIAMGAFFSITGPTLPILASNMGVSLAVANWSITVRSFMQMLGSLLPDLVFPKCSPLLLLAFAIIGNGISLSLMPLFTGIIIYAVH